MRRGEIAAVVFVTSKPVDAFVKGKWEEGFKFLPVEYGPKFEDYYRRRRRLTPPTIPTCSPRASGIADHRGADDPRSFNWRPGTPRYRRVARFVDELFGRIDKLQLARLRSEMEGVNLAATAPGLERFQAAQDWLDRKVAARRERP